MTVAGMGMLQAAKTVKRQLQDMRLDANFAELLTKVEREIEDFDLDSLVVTRPQKPQARFCGLALAFHTTSVEKYYRVEYVKLIDVAVQQLDDLLLKRPSLARYCQLEAILLSGQITDIASLCPELRDIKSLQTQLDMFHFLILLATSQVHHL